MVRYRITIQDAGSIEQTWVLLPDEASARMQAEEEANRRKTARIRVYREEPGRDPELLRDLERL